jgi:hypothetical protein
MILPRLQYAEYPTFRLFPYQDAWLLLSQNKLKISFLECSTSPSAVWQWFLFLYDHDSLINLQRLSSCIYSFMAIYFKSLAQIITIALPYYVHSQ